MNELTLFDPDPEPEVETWLTHKWWECRDLGCRFCHAPQKGIEAAERADALWANQSYDWILQRPTGALFTADDLIDALGLGTSSASVGAVFRKASQAGLIRVASFTTSNRETNHGRILRVWERI